MLSTVLADGESLIVTPGGNVGIGTETPMEKLEVNGAIKFSPNGSTISRAPRVIHTQDLRTGCPPVAPANSDLFTQEITLATSADVVVNVNTIAISTARVDTLFYVDGGFKYRTLTAAINASWKPVIMTWGGTLVAGTHTISIRSTQANTHGCGKDWGVMTTTIYE